MVLGTHKIHLVISLLLFWSDTKKDTGKKNIPDNIFLPDISSKKAFSLIAWRDNLFSWKTPGSPGSPGWYEPWLWEFSCIMDWSEIQKSEILPSEFCPISEDWGWLGKPSLTQMYLIRCSYILQNTRVGDFTISDLLRKKQQGVKLPAN